jgi:hypothetical protein
MTGLHTLDLAATLDAARREELRTATMRARSSPPNRLRTAAGAWLVRAGNRLLESPRDLAPSSAGSTGS